ncbi:MAG: glycerate kinase type-2 family protein [Anaerolineae bacterium]|jgi:glycerate 2-kinase
MASFDAALWQRGGLEERRRREVVSIMEAALAAVDPGAAVERALQREGDLLLVYGRRYDLAAIDRVWVVGAGKAGAPMASAVERVLGERVSGGLVNVKYAHVQPTERVALNEAGHPIPDEQGVEGARRIAALLAGAGERDLVICLISGGGSALMTLPAEGISLGDMQALTAALLAAGATINEINAIRKHLDVVKGGGLARLAAPARVVALLLSDVVGNPLDVIASGPTVPDTATFADAQALLERYGLWEQAPAAIRQRLQRGVAGELPDTPKAGDPLFERVQNVIVASNDIAARAAEERARELGYRALVWSTYVEGEAREVARVQAALAKEMLSSGRPVAPPACLISGGETTVTLRGQGRGGRNQEMALAAAIALEGWDNVAIACLATDGTDGPTDASGAYADGSTLARARALGLDAWAHLQNNDAYPFFAQLGDLLLTGPTNTNVNDLTLVFAW